MRRTIWLCVLTALCAPPACTGAATHPANPGTTAGGTVQVVAPTIPQAPYDVAPGELAGGEVYLKLRHRVRIARTGVAFLKIDGARVDAIGAASTPDARPMLPVIAETDERVRVVAEEDHARIALWLPRSDLAQSVLAPVQIADASGHAPATSGVWLGAGASIDADDRKAATGFHELALRSPWLEASGYVPNEALGQVWLAGEREGYEPSTAEDDSKPPVETGSTVAVTTLRATPDANGAVVAQIIKAAPARVVRKLGAWTEIEIHVPRVRAHGFVASSAVTDGDHAELGRFGHGAGYGSTAARVHVRAGACLYDAASGEVAGVNLGNTERIVGDGAPTPGWTRVIVTTAWGNVTAFVHEVPSAEDPKKPDYESCVTKK